MPRPGAGPAQSWDPPGADDLDDLDDLAGLDDFGPLDDLDQEPTPALLAAKAEPLDRPGSGRPGGRKPQRSNRRPSRPSGGGPRRPPGRSGGRRKPREPSKLLLGVGIVVVLAAGFGAAYLYSRSTDDAPPTEGAGTTVDDPASELGQSGSTVTTAPNASTESTAATVSGQPPAVVFDEAANGPINADTEYTIGVSNGPEGAQYRLLVDGEPYAEPAPQIPPATFSPGRHLLEVEITTPTGTANIDPVVVYAIGPRPTETTWRANLSSVNVAEEGWAEAVRQYEQFVAAGHGELQLMPSDWFPSLVPGYWNLFVDGFAGQDAAEAYCEQHGLAMPDSCFPQFFDPSAPAGG